jgi:2-polyprenyl-3-methyl-5-hydroxy-6-metoxy-1,4-benzoquinol methylase
MKTYLWQKEWEEYFEDGRYIEWVPHESLVRFEAKFLKHKRGKNLIKILDHGCGAGRHIQFLARKGYSCFGADIAWEGLKISKGKDEK